VNVRVILGVGEIDWGVKEVALDDVEGADGREQTGEKVRRFALQRYPR